MDWSMGILQTAQRNIRSSNALWPHLNNNQHCTQTKTKQATFYKNQILSSLLWCYVQPSIRSRNSEKIKQRIIIYRLSTVRWGLHLVILKNVHITTFYVPEHPKNCLNYIVTYSASRRHFDGEVRYKCFSENTCSAFNNDLKWITGIRMAPTHSARITRKSSHTNIRINMRKAKDNAREPTTAHDFETHHIGRSTDKKITRRRFVKNPTSEMK